VQGARDQLLAGAGLAVDQHRGGSDRGLLDEPVDLLHRRAAADEPAHAPDVLDPAPQDRDLVERAGALQRLLDQQSQPLEVDRLGEVVVGALAHRGDRGVDGGLSGEDDDRYPGHLLLERAEQAQAVHVRHHEVGHHQRRVERRRLLQGIVTLGRGIGGVAPGRQDGLERGARILLVVDDQDVGSSGHASQGSNRHAARTTRWKVAAAQRNLRSARAVARRSTGKHPIGRGKNASRLPTRIRIEKFRPGKERAPRGPRTTPGRKTGPRGGRRPGRALALRDRLSRRRAHRERGERSGP
jgi:hypothetical protein